MDRAYYLRLRRRYEPKRAKLVIVAESPPARGTYFYNPEGRVNEWLFAALMGQLGQTKAPSKNAGLLEFQRAGWVLVDATYQPIDKGLNDSGRNRVIERDYPLLVADLETLMPDRRAVPLVLVKANVCRLLEPKLVKDGFRVLNRGSDVFFPSHGRQPEFKRQFRAILSEII